MEADYEWMTRELMALAERHSEKRIVSMLEGGYNLGALGRSAVACKDARRTLSGPRRRPTPFRPLTYHGDLRGRRFRIALQQELHRGRIRRIGPLKSSAS